MLPSLCVFETPELSVCLNTGNQKETIGRSILDKIGITDVFFKLTATKQKQEQQKIRKKCLKNKNVHTHACTYIRTKTNQQNKTKKGGGITTKSMFILTIAKQQKPRFFKQMKNKPTATTKNQSSKQTYKNLKQKRVKLFAAVLLAFPFS